MPFFFKNLCFQQPLRTWRNSIVSSAVIVKPACESSQFVSRGLSHLMVRWKNGQKLLSPWKKLFFEMFFFYRPLRSQRSDLIICTIFVKIPCGPLQVIHWHLSSSIKGEKLGLNLCFIGKIAFCSKNCVFNNLLCLKSWSYYFHNNCQSISWTLMICFLTFLMFDKKKKNRPKSFLHWKVCRFFNNLLGPKVLIL